MMSVLEIFKVIIPIFIITLLGFIFGRYRKGDQKTFADFIIYISTPALVLSQLSMLRIHISELLGIVASGTLVILGCGALAFLIFKSFKMEVPQGLYLPIMFMNSGFLGFPLAMFAYGSAGLAKAIIYNIPLSILVFAVGIYLVSRRQDRWQVLKLPYLYAAALGLLLSFSGVRLPQYIYSPIYLLGGTTVPLALFMLGCRLATLKIVSLKLPLLASLMRIGLGLVLGLLAVFLFRLDGTTARVVILISSLSSAVFALVIAEKYDADSDLVASTVALSTLISFGTMIPILFWLRNFF